MQIAKESIGLYYMDITEKISDREYQQGKKLVAKEKLERLNRFCFVEDQKRSLYGDLLCRYLATMVLGVRNQELLFCQNAYGKTYLEGREDFQYNISHSGRYVVCGISKTQIGVDIEQIKGAPTDIAKRFFTASEYVALKQADPSIVNDLFYTYWTLKESYIKYRGMGLSLPLDSFLFIKKGEQYELIDKKEELQFLSCVFMQDYRVAVTYRGAIFDGELQLISLKEILSVLTK